MEDGTCFCDCAQFEEDGFFDNAYDGVNDAGDFVYDNASDVG